MSVVLFLVYFATAIYTLLSFLLFGPLLAATKWLVTIAG